MTKINNDINNEIESLNKNLLELTNLINNNKKSISYGIFVIEKILSGHNINLNGLYGLLLDSLTTHICFTGKTDNTKYITLIDLIDINNTNTLPGIFNNTKYDEKYIFVDSIEDDNDAIKLSDLKKIYKERSHTV